MLHRNTLLRIVPIALATSLLACDRDIEGERGQDIQARAEEAAEDRPGWRWQWTDHDENADELIDRAEWDARFRERFRDFDLDRSDELTDVEVRRGIYQWWDFDDDDYIDRDEFDPDFVRSIGVDAEHQDFAAWDRNVDQRIDEAEFGRAWDATGRFDAWDADGDEILTEQELGEGWFGGWDTDRSGTLERREWGWRARGAGSS